jgi:tRNA G10  N-methylase Trm11
MEYFFILGNHPALSMAELLACLKQAQSPHLYGPNALVLNLPEDYLTEDFLKTIGGTIKFGKIEAKLAHVNKATLDSVKILEKYLPDHGKFSFGISSYGKGIPRASVVGMTIKNKLREAGVSCRWVTSREETLSSVVVEQNKLLTTGKELVFLGSDKEVLIGTTIAVQPFKDLSDRDYGRPARDDQSGMLPPKLAQIMINLAQIAKTEILLDPFCGSGTILTEAILMGYKNIIGTDLSIKAVNDSKTNIDWTVKKYNLKREVVVKQMDARFLTSLFKDSSLGAIVAETYLGPQRGKIDLVKVSRELSELYNECLKKIYLILKPGKRVVLAIPAFVGKDKLNYLPLDFGKFKLADLPPLELMQVGGRTPRQGFLYGRAGQKVFREIIVLKK